MKPREKFNDSARLAERKALLRQSVSLRVMSALKRARASQLESEAGAARRIADLASQEYEEAVKRLEGVE